MGGSGSRGWRPTAPSNPCARLAFRAVVNSPQAAVLMTLNVDDELDIQLQMIPTTAVVAMHNGQIVGALTGTNINSLVNCIQNGFQYKAKVVSLAGGNCTVDVHVA